MQTKLDFMAKEGTSTQLYVGLFLGKRERFLADSFGILSLADITHAIEILKMFLRFIIFFRTPRK